jgi:hypothetical protein
VCSTFLEREVAELLNNQKDKDDFKVLSLYKKTDSLAAERLQNR